MFAMLQFVPDSAMPDWTYGDEKNPGVDVIALNPSRPTLKKFLTRYKKRHAAACAEWDAWDRDKSIEWNDAHDAKLTELEAKYRIEGGTMPGTRWAIVEIWDGASDGSGQAEAA